jgi:hypothetical protein
MFALNFLGVFLADLMLLGIEMPLIGPPTIGVRLRDAKRCQAAKKAQDSQEARQWGKAVSAALHAQKLFPYNPAGDQISPDEFTQILSFRKYRTPSK